MGKLSLEALKERAEATASTELLATISGGLENACHDGPSKLYSTINNLQNQQIIYDFIRIMQGN